LTRKPRSLTRRGRRCILGHYILHSEEEKAIKKMGIEKATDDDKVPGDVLKMVGEFGLTLLIHWLSSYTKLESGKIISLKLQ
jgi:hypothetical protein